MALALVVAAGAALVALVATPAGARWAFQRLGAAVPGSLTVQQLDGPLRGPLRVEGLVWESDGAEVSVDELHLQWRLRDLLARQLDITQLSASTVRVRLAESGEEEEPSALPDLRLPIAIVVRQARVDDLVVLDGSGESLIEVRSIELRTRAEGERVEIERFELVSPDLELEVAGSVEPVGDYAVDLSLRWGVAVEAAESAGDGAAGSDRSTQRTWWRGEGTLGGSLEELTVAQELSAPLRAGIDAVLRRPLRDLSLDGTLTLPRTELADLAAVASASSGEAASPELPSGALSGTLAVRGSLERLELRPDLALVSSDPLFGELGSGASAASGASEAVTLELAGTAIRTLEGARGQDQRIDLEPLELRVGEATLALRGAVLLPAAGDGGEAAEPRLALEATWTEARWPLLGTAQVTSPAGTGRLDGALSGLELRARAELDSPMLPEAARLGELELRASGSVERLELDVTANALGGSLGIAGTLGFGEIPSWDLRVRGRGLDPFLLQQVAMAESGPDEGGSAQAPDADADGADGADGARAATTADLQAWGLGGAVDVDLETRGEARPEGVFGRVVLGDLGGSLRQHPLRGSGAVVLAGEAITVEDVIVRWAEGDALAELVVDGRVAPELEIEWRLQAAELALVHQSAGGTLRASGTARGPTATPRVALELTGERLAWTDTRVGSLSASADVDLGQEGEVDFAAGAEDLVLGGQTLEAASLSGDGTRGAHRLTLEARGAAGAEPLPRRLRLVARGGLNGGAELAEEAGQPVGAAGSASETTPLSWRGELAGLEIDGLAGSDWRSEAAAALEMSSASAELERLCLDGPESGRVCVEASWSTGVPEEDGEADPRTETIAGGAAWRVNAALTQVPLTLLEPWLPPSSDLSGPVSGRLSARSGQAAEAGAGSTPAAILAEASLQPGPGELTFVASGPGAGRERVTFGRGSLQATLDDSGARLAFELPLDELGDVDGELQLPGFLLGGSADQVTAATQPLRGALRMRVDDLSFVQGLTDQISDLEGSVRADLDVAGTVEAPELRGVAALEGGRASLPELGIELMDLGLVVRGDRLETAASVATPGAEASAGQPLRIEGSLRSGGGTLRISGQSPLIPRPEDPLVLALEGEELLAMNTREIELYASPDLELRFDGERLALSGEVVVPRAEIEIDEAPEGTVEASPDVVVIGRESPAAAGDLPLALRVRVVLGDDVDVEALGLDAEPKGSLLLVDEPGRPTYGSGEIDVSGGTFEAYGQDLRIERGRLVFSGPIDLPRVDLRAYRQARDGVVAGLEARGPLDAPEITLWSEPPMSQADQLSYILLGRPIDSVGQSEGDSDLVAKAASALGLKGGNLLAERLGARFGLEEARLETDGGLEEASLVLGKYLTPRLYVAYGVGLFEAVNTMRLRYVLSTKWTLEATTGIHSGADLLYTIERGRGAKRRVPAVQEVEEPKGPSGDDGTEGREAQEDPPPR
ncbi:MAG: hypothetical protein DWQ30_12950 [Acidobacteria bacterium]|nr:MAG: hypothetical protein DWQ30_12950 [Acidobacteriota bacterium]